jgi:hypothetical protein
MAPSQRNNAASIMDAIDSLPGIIVISLFTNGREGAGLGFAGAVTLTAGLAYNFGFNVLVLANHSLDFRASRAPVHPGSANPCVLASLGFANHSRAGYSPASLRRNNAGYICSRNSSVVDNHNGRNSADYSRTHRKRHKSHSYIQRKGRNRNYRKRRHCRMAEHKRHNHSESR